MSDWQGKNDKMTASAAQQQRQKELQKQYRNLLCSVILDKETFDLLKNYCLDSGQTLPQGVRSAVAHVMKCYQKVE
jgi:hypothetical protein